MHYLIYVLIEEVGKGLCAEHDGSWKQTFYSDKIAHLVSSFLFSCNIEAFDGDLEIIRFFLSPYLNVHIHFKTAQMSQG